MNTSATSDSDGGRSGSAASDAKAPGPASRRPRVATANGQAVSPSPVAWTPSQFKPHTISQAREHKNERANTSANADRQRRNVREYTLGEEIANSVTHGIGVLLAIAAIPILVVAAVSGGGGVKLAAALVYAITMLVEYLMSTLYHAIAADRAKRVFKVLDHSGIYLFIAGTYTPYCLVTLGSSGGVGLAVFVWVVALAGVACEAFWVFRPRWVSAVLYLLLGWSVVWFLPALVANLAPAGFWLLVAGGLSYTVGCVFYVLKKIPYMHSVFHVFVVAASVLQFLSIALYVM